MREFRQISGSGEVLSVTAETAGHILVTLRLPDHAARDWAECIGRGRTDIRMFPPPTPEEAEQIDAAIANRKKAESELEARGARVLLSVHGTLHRLVVGGMWVGCYCGWMPYRTEGSFGSLGDWPSMAEARAANPHAKLCRRCEANAARRQT